MTDLFDSLRRWPDVEAENLFAFDASDRLILETAHDALLAAAPATVVVIGDNYGALTLGSLQAGAAAPIRVHQDALTGELALAANGEEFADRFTNHPLDESLLAGATVVLWQLPRSLDELDEVAEAIARWADPSVVVYAGGRIKHLTPTMNPVLLTHFETLDITRAQQKSRGFVLRAPKPSTQSRYPLTETHNDLGLTIAAHGAAFAGTGIDIGTRLLLSTLRKAKADASVAIDLGSGTGVLAAALAKARPELRIIASDQSAAAVASSTATMKLNGLDDRVTVVRDDGLVSQPDASADIVLLNPPFHIGAVVHTGLAQRMFADAARVLRPGGELWTVFNTHLGYRQALQRIVGPTDLVTHNAKFTVTVSHLTPTGSGRPAPRHED
ncbi:MAG: class I SAM-dependent methyltransferase [Microbacteriaceae bacterium]